MTSVQSVFRIHSFTESLISDLSYYSNSYFEFMISEPNYTLQIFKHQYRWYLKHERRPFLN